MWFGVGGVNWWIGGCIEVEQDGMAWGGMLLLFSIVVGRLKYTKTKDVRRVRSAPKSVMDQIRKSILENAKRMDFRFPDSVPQFLYACIVVKGCIRI